MSPARSAACDTARTVSAIDPAVAASCWIVADVCATAADCSLVTAAAFRAATRSSPATSPSTTDADRNRTSNSSRSRSILTMKNAKPIPARTARAAAADADGQRLAGR